MQKLYIADDSSATLYTEEMLRKEYATDTEFCSENNVDSFESYIAAREGCDLTYVDFSYKFESALAYNIWNGALSEAQDVKSSQALYEIVSLYLENNMPYDDWIALCGMLWANECDYWDYDGKLLEELRRERI